MDCIMAEALTLARIESLFEGYGSAYYGREAITQTEHALQCAALAEQAGESAALIAASLLHDVGHLVMAESELEDKRHQEIGARLLGDLLGENVVAPVRLHVPAKRYLCAVDAAYWSTLSQASKDSLALQGGPFTAQEVEAFERLPFFAEAVRLRKYDDMAKVPGAVTPPLRHYLGMLEAIAV
jgi:phosphonate degradation associated HDIG domain protein